MMEIAALALVIGFMLSLCIDLARRNRMSLFLETEDLRVTVDERRIMLSYVVKSYLWPQCKSFFIRIGRYRGK